MDYEEKITWESNEYTRNLLLDMILFLSITKPELLDIDNYIINNQQDEEYHSKFH